jgi:hypothetical protein
MAMWGDGEFKSLDNLIGTAVEGIRELIKEDGNGKQ